MTFDQLRDRILALTGVPPEDFDNDGDLVDFGLDSIQVLTLVEEWQGLGIQIDFSDLLAEPTLNGWWRAISRKAGWQS